ncbi:MAG: hypothetical protein R3293_02610 [Candidatus Promineifilaceae bacterium]|nr:hypothetical protein [Candidatus Promineifilaceae bacterium]
MRSSWAKAFHNATILTMSEDEKSPKVLYADPEHGGLRFVVIVVLLFSLIVGFFIIQLLLNLLASETRLIEFATVLSCAFAFPLAFAITWVVEIILKREWHSGNSLTLDDSQLSYRIKRDDNDPSEQNGLSGSIEWAKRVNTLYWYFKLKGYPRAGREQRVSKSWLGVACQLQQDETRLIVYSYVPPQRAANWTEDDAVSEPFIEISLADLYKRAGQNRRFSSSTRPKVDAELLTGTEGRYWLAEQKRWSRGLELTQQDFAYFINYVEKRIGVES